MRNIRHSPVREQPKAINMVLRGHYNYYGLAGNIPALCRFKQETEKYWRRMLSSRSQYGKLSWEKYRKTLEAYPLAKPELKITYPEMKEYVVL